MSEKLYGLLLKLYPQPFRRAYGDEALRLVLDRARDEKGFFGGLRLWLDLLVDLAMSLPGEYIKAATTRSLVASPVHGHPSFQLLTRRSPHPALLLVAGLLTAAAFWTCGAAVARSRALPAQFPVDSYSLQEIVQGDMVLAQSGSADSAPAGAYSFCMTARRDLPGDPLQPLLRFSFAAPGASGAALIDGKIIRQFKNEKRLSISPAVSAGNHWFVVRVDRPAENASISRSKDFGNCPAN